jgi:hypothetical protein
MEIQGKQFLVLYLEDWQRRMIKDLLGVTTHVWRIPTDSGPVARYLPAPARSVPPKAKRMYLTDWQRKEIKDTTGEECEFVELVPQSNLKYLPPPRLSRKR